MGAGNYPFIPAWCASLAQMEGGVFDRLGSIYLDS